MSTTATSLVPSSVKSTANSAIQTTRNVASAVQNTNVTSALQDTRTVVSREVTNTSGYVAQKAQNLGLTPTKPSPQTAQFSTPPPSPGTFRHPKTTEILARNAATSLLDGRIRSALTNTAALILSFVFSDAFSSSVKPLLHAAGVTDASEISSTLLLIIRLIICTNIILLLRPVIPYISKKDEIADIPLTPSQRSLLGLDPSAQPTPSPAGSSLTYITPPRYRRSSGSPSGGSSFTTQNGSRGMTNTERRSNSANYSTSPLSTSRYSRGFSPTPSQSVRRVEPSSAFSPSPTASPLFHKALNQSSQQSDMDFGASTRSFLGGSIGAGLGRSQSLRERPGRESLESASPTPGAKSPQVVPGLNYKWLYDKGRSLPTGESRGF
ncbi:nuclear pore complex component-domain-containing protein [Exophiala viscosa]|uniref:Nuclear pore complex component-domain-containing protein n=1 Tax=Exophiala viscosa TaxID=2486360 RepID=A0AAN6E0R9_9EURO|nr:nuclear pore complex component-domain-containing protein [Exophiala viscosa]KAI1621801.1 nuclear pore complex component-domain-containing protein [Exophiala viscosa]